MHMIAISEAKAKLTELARIADHQPVLLLRHSRPAAGMLSYERYTELMDRLENAEDLAVVLQDRLDPDETVTLDALKARLAASKRTA